MSDIYLQITETPTVVTLSAPVVSGALASTVTVANTVTVALDSNSLSALENVTVTVGAAITGTVTVSNFPASQAVTFSAVTISNLPSTQTITGTVTANVQPQQSDDTDENIKFIPIGYATVDGGGQLDQWTAVDQLSPLPVYFPANNPIPAGTNRIGVVTIGGGTVTIGAGTSQIGSVTASIGLNSVGPSVIADSGFSLSTRGMIVVGGISTSDVGSDNEYRELKITSSGEALVRGTVTIGSLPALAAGTAQIGSVTASISNSVVTFYPMQGTSVSNTNFTSTTASTTLVSAVANREVLTVFNEGPANLFISPGATCTSASYQIRLSSGDYWECPQGQLSLAHTAVFATSGTARVTEVS
jgi:hypothetical protein